MFIIFTLVYTFTEQIIYTQINILFIHPAFSFFVRGTFYSMLLTTLFLIKEFFFNSFGECSFCKQLFFKAYSSSFSRIFVVPN